MPNSQPTNNPRGLSHVLVLRFSALGDVAMTVPVIYSACRCYPDVHFTMVTRPSMTSLFVNPPSNFSVVGADLNGKYRGLRGMRRLLRDLRAARPFDGVIDLHDVLRTKALRLMCRLRRIPVAVINKGRQGKRALTRQRGKVLLPLISTRARYRQVFHHIGLPVESCFDGLFGRGSAPANMFADITGPRPQGERWIGIAPFAKHRGKVYPPSLMGQVIAALAALPDTRIFIFGAGADEERQAAEWAQRFPSVTSLAGKRYGFPAELALVSHLHVMVSMDSANMHLASLVNTPVVSVWGATHPYCGFKGWRQREDDIVQLPLTCRPCSVFGNKPCFRGDYLCLTGITPQTIVERVVAHLPTAKE